MLGAFFRWFSPRNQESVGPTTTGSTGAGTPYAASIRSAERQILALARQQCPKATVFSFGAVDINPRHLAIWITTPGDAERDRLKSSRSFEASCRAALAGAGYPAEAIALVGFAFESQETVNRDHGGNWWYAVK